VNFQYSAAVHCYSYQTDSQALVQEDLQQMAECLTFQEKCLLKFDHRLDNKKLKAMILD
jgi:hypothetical protein